MNSKEERKRVKSVMGGKNQKKKKKKMCRGEKGMTGRLDCVS